MRFGDIKMSFPNEVLVEGN